MNAHNIPVLLTSSIIAYDPGVSLSDTNARLHYAMESIARWLEIDPEIQLILCDGSSFDFSETMAQRFPGARIECLPFENNQQLVRERGRGYGEGEIVRFAIENSKLIAAAGCFSKCTSKLWVKNYIKCRQQWNGTQMFKGVFSNVFSLKRKIEFDYIDTRFYMISKEIYKKYYINAHLDLDTAGGESLEKRFLKIFLENQIHSALFSVAPVIEGVGGGIGFSYRNPLKRRIKETLRLQLAMGKRQFSSYFFRPPR